jgi:molybdopterin/thiamine biosynthesis adenylyltransferase
MNDFAMHSRQIALPGWGRSGQEKLKQQKVLIIGAGGLGTNLSLMLAASGLGSLCLMDYDQVDESNLSRQILYAHADVGRPKSKVAIDFLSVRYPTTKFTAIQKKFDEQVFDEVKNVDFVFDCTDDIPSRYIIEKFSKQHDKPWISGSLHRFQGQLALFHWKVEVGKRSKNYSDFFPESKHTINAGACSDHGIAPYFPALIAQLMAGEYFKAVIAYTQPIFNELLLVDGLDLSIKKISL